MAPILFSVAALGLIAFLFGGKRTLFGGKVTFVYLPHHLWQIGFHSSVWLYWALWVPEVAQRTPWLIGQYFITFFLDALASRIFRGKWIVSLAAMPFTTAINFFIWVTPGNHWLDVVLLAGAVFSRPLIRWRDGRSHIFNPSAVVLTAAGIINLFHHLPAFGVDHLMNLPPMMAEYLLIIGLLTQTYARTWSVTVSAGLTLFLANLLLVGQHTPSPLYPQILLGITLGVTDPATSPKSNTGKVLFGCCYGVALTVISMLLLRYNHKDDFYAKLFAISVVNPLVPILTRGAARIEALPDLKTMYSWTALHRRGTVAMALAVWVTAFTLALTLWGHADFESALHEQRREAWIRFDHGTPVCKGDWVCQPFAFHRAFAYLIAGR